MFVLGGEGVVRVCWGVDRGIGGRGGSAMMNVLIPCPDIYIHSPPPPFSTSLSPPSYPPSPLQHINANNPYPQTENHTTFRALAVATDVTPPGTFPFPFPLPTYPFLHPPFPISSLPQPANIPQPPPAACVANCTPPPPPLPLSPSPPPSTPPRTHNPYR